MDSNKTSVMTKFGGEGAEGQKWKKLFVLKPISRERKIVLYILKISLLRIRKGDIEVFPLLILRKKRQSHAYYLLSELS